MLELIWGNDLVVHQSLDELLLGLNVRQQTVLVAIMMRGSTDVDVELNAALGHQQVHLVTVVVHSLLY